MPALYIHSSVALISMPSTALKAFITSYQWAWSAALPLLRRHHRVGPGYDQRLIKRDPLPQVDLWVQSASAGEAYLAGLLNTHLRPRGPLRVLFTTNTLQGFDILKRTIGNPDPDTPPSRRWSRPDYTVRPLFPF